MNEQEWSDCANPKVMLEVLRGKGSDRKFRLFACACCRRAWSLLRDERSRQGIEVVERYADKQAGEEELRTALEAALAAHNALWDDCARKSRPVQEEIYQDTIEMEAALAVWRTCKARQAYANDVTIAFAPLRPAAYAVGGGERESGVEGIMSEYAVQASLLRDIFGNPFRPITLNSAWLTPTVVQLARTIYDDRAFDKMPILAHALHDAGCDNDEILAHLRGPGPHVRGCWALDMVLGKE